MSSKPNFGVLAKWKRNRSKPSAVDLIDALTSEGAASSSSVPTYAQYHHSDYTLSHKLSTATEEVVDYADSGVVDVSARAAHLEFMRSVLEKGARLDQLPPAEGESTFAELAALLRQADLSTALALCEVCPAAQFEELVEVLLKVFTTDRRLSSLLKAVIEREVAGTDHESTLFRGNSFATRILTVYARTRGYHYLRNTLRDLLLTLCQKPQEFAIDFDPHRQTAHDEAATRNLEQFTEAFLACITSSIDHIPRPIREMTSHIAESVGARFPESVFTAVGGFIFLRFINPAIVSPETIDLDLPVDNRDIRRSLVLVTKVLQALANNVRFGAKEPGMRQLNDWMDKTIFGMTRFLQAISVPVPDDDHPDLTTAGQDGPHLDAALDVSLDEGDKAFLHQFITEHKSKIGSQLLSASQSGKQHSHDSSETFSRSWDKLCQIMAALGPSADEATKAVGVLRPGQSAEQAHREFMDRNAARTKTEIGGSWGSVFYETAPTKAGLVAFCLVPTRVKADTADIESLVYHIAKTLSKPSTPFEVLIDCTNFSSANEVPGPWLRQLLLLVLPGVDKLLSRVILYSPNSMLKRYLRKLNRTLAFDRFDSRRIAVITSPNELEFTFPKLDPILPGTTVALLKEHRTAFTHITHRSPVAVEHPVLFKLGPRTLIVSTVKKQDLFADLRATIEDVIDLGDVEELRKIHLGVEGVGVSIKLRGEKDPRRFLVKARRDELFSALVHARNQAPTKPATYRDRQLRPEDATAVVVHAVLSNLASSHDSLRTRAFALLESIARSFAIDSLADIVSAPGLYIPAAHLTLMAHVSERLAVALPDESLGVFVQLCAGLGGSTSSEGAACLYALRPWLHNLYSLAHTPREDRERVHLKARQCLRQLLSAAVRDAAMHAVLLIRIWPAIGKIDFLLPFALDEAVRALASHDTGAELDPAERVSEVMVALGAGTPFRGKLLAKLRHAISRTSARPVNNLTRSSQWPEIAALARLDLALSFDSRQSSQLYLPEICHIVMSLVAVGPAVIRQTVQSLLISTVHTLASDPAADELALRGMLDTLTAPGAAELFGLPNSKTGVTVSWSASVAGEEIAALLLTVIQAAAPTLDAANAWRARWTSLAVSSCFQHNPALQTRSFTALGQLGQGELDQDLCFQMLTTLRTAIRLSSTNDGSFAVSIIRCLNSSFPGLPLDSHYYPAVTWLALGLCEIGHPAIVAAAVPLLSTTLSGLERAGWFAQRDLGSVLLDLRDVEGSPAYQRVDDAAGLSFETSFSFSVVTLLVKCLKLPAVAAGTEQLLYDFLRCSRAAELNSNLNEARYGAHKLDPDSLPFFLALLPLAVNENKLDALLAACGLDNLIDPSLPEWPTERLETLASRLAIDDSAVALLSTALLIALANVAESDRERTAILVVLGQIALDHAEVAEAQFEPIGPALIQAVIASPSRAGSSRLVQHAVRMLEAQAGKHTASHESSLAEPNRLFELGFPALGAEPVARFSEDDLAAISPAMIDIADLVAVLVAQSVSEPVL